LVELDMVVSEALREVVALDQLGLAGGLDVEDEEAGTEGSQLVEVLVLILEGSNGAVDDDSGRVGELEAVDGFAITFRNCGKIAEFTIVTIAS